jgi:DNA-binding transcriptional MerR regulator
MAKRGVSRTRKGVAKPKPKPKPKPKAPKKQTGSPIKSKRKDKIIIDPNSGEQMVVKEYDKYPDAVRYVAKIMYISGQAMPSEIAKKFNLNVHTVRSWQKRDRWTFLKRQVTRLANKDAVKAARKAMSRYITDIDRGLNEQLTTLNERLSDVTDENKMKDEYLIIRTILDVWKMKLTLFRALTYGVHGKAFYPHPSNLRLDGTEDPSAIPTFGQTELDKILSAVPDYMKAASKFVTGMGPEDIDEDVLDALTIHLEELKEAEEEEQRAKAKTRRKLKAGDEDQDALDLDLDPVEELLEAEDEED